MKFLELFGKFDIGEPPWEYNFLLNLDESEYPKYLKKFFEVNTVEKLPLSIKWKIENGKIKVDYVIDKNKCKTFNQKIQWLKLYDATPLKKMCTDKVLVRDYVAEKIGEEYLKPVLQVITKEGVYINPVMLNSFQHLSNDELIKKLLDNKRQDWHADIKMSSSARNDGEPLASGIENDVTTYQPVIANHNSILGGEAIQKKQSLSDTNENLDENQFKLSMDWHADTKMSSSARNDSGLNTLVPDVEKNVSTYFDKIQFDKLPNAFVMKCSHGCKWQYIIKDKEEYLKTKPVFELTKKNMTGWLEQDYSFFGGFEMQYKMYSPHPNPPQMGRENVYSHSIVPKILIEPFMRDDINKDVDEIFIYCFNGEVKYAVKLYKTEDSISIWDENLNITQDIFDFKERKTSVEADNNVKLAVELSKKITKDFKFVRVDWHLYQNKIYFAELTFTPYSGLHKIKNRKNNLKLGKLMKI